MTEGGFRSKWDLKLVIQTKLLTTVWSGLVQHSFDCLLPSKLYPDAFFENCVIK